MSGWPGRWRCSSTMGRGRTVWGGSTGEGGAGSGPTEACWRLVILISLLSYKQKMIFPSTPRHSWQLAYKHPILTGEENILDWVALLVRNTPRANFTPIFAESVDLWTPLFDVLWLFLCLCVPRNSANTINHTSTLSQGLSSQETCSVWIMVLVSCEKVLYPYRLSQKTAARSVSQMA